MGSAVGFQPRRKLNGFMEMAKISLLMVCGALALRGAPLHAQGDPFCVDLSGVAHVGFDYTSGTITQPANCACTDSCTVGFRCYPPVLAAVQYELLPAGCDPTATACTVRATVPTQYPGNSQSIELLGSGGHLNWTSSGGSDVGTCGFAGAEIYGDEGNAWIEVSNFSCAAPSGTETPDTYSLNATECDAACPVSPPASTTVPVDLTLPTLKAMYCSKPPTHGCPDDPAAGTCCLGPAGSSSPAGAGPGAGGPGVGAGPSGAGGGFGPGTFLWYLAGGAGALGLPGSTARNVTLGRHWSHSYAEQIVPAPDQSNVWLITRYGTFRQFSSPGGGGVYTVRWPKDEYRSLQWLGAGLGWTLTSLDGTVESFNAAGLWTATTDRNGNARTAVYSGSTLTQVLLPDLRTEDFSYDPGTGKLSEIDEVGIDGTTKRVWRYTWTGLDLTGIARPDGTSFQFIYGDSRYPGYMTQMNLVGTDSSVSIEAAWAYDDTGNVAAVWRGSTSPTGSGAIEQYSFSYTNPLQPTQTVVTDPMGKPITFALTWDAGSTKPKVTQTAGDCPVCGSGGSVVTYGYADPANPLLATSVVDGRSLDTELTYDANGRMLTRTDATGTSLQRTSSWIYGNSSFPAFPTVIDQPSTAGSAVRESALLYDTAGNLTSRTESGIEAGAAFSYTTAKTWNAAGMPLTIDPPGYGSGDVTTYTYDPAHGNLLPLTRTDPIVGTTTFEYDVFGNRTAETDANGSRTERTYDALNRVTSVTRKGDPSDPQSVSDLVTTYTYTPLGDIGRITLPAQNVVDYNYDGARRLTAYERRPVQNAENTAHGNRELYTLDAFGHRTRIDYQHFDTTANAFASDSYANYQYSSRCHLDKLIQPDGSAIEYAYDCDNNPVQMWDANHPSGGQTNPPTESYSYDSLNRKTTLSEAWGGTGGGSAVTTFTYDVADHLASVTDPNGNVTTYTTSDRDLVTSRSDVVSGTTTYAYNEHGLSTSEVDARPVTIARTFDALDRLTQVTYPDPTVSVTYTYDDPAVSYSKGRMTAVMRNGASVGYSYDVYGNLRTDGPFTYYYDLNGNHVYTYYPGPMGMSQVLYDYEDLPYFLSIGFPLVQGIVRGGTYLPSGPLTQLSFKNGLHTPLLQTFSYDTQYRPTEIKAGGLLDWVYTTDSMGNVTAISDALNPANNRTYSYQDTQYYLTASSGPWGAQTTTYDKIGNRLSQNGASYSYTANGSGGNTPLLTAAGALAYAYDALGNATTVGGTAFTYDAARQLAQIAPDRTFVYDGRGFLQQATSPSSTPTSTAQVYYSADGLLRYRHDANASGTHTSDAYFLYFNDRPVLQWEQVVDSGVTTTNALFLVTDQLGTPIMTTPSATGPTWSDSRDPFGANSDNSLTNGTYLRFPGQWLDSWARYSAAFDLSNNVFRWYDAQTARYTSPETSDAIYERQEAAVGRFDLTELPGFRPTLQLFDYAEQNPLLYVDPWGLTPYTNHSKQPVPYKPEVGDKVIYLCYPGENCDVDGIYPVDCKDYPIKIVDGCTAETTASGELKIDCPMFKKDAPDLKRHFPWAGQQIKGGRTDKQFHQDHPDWLPPNGRPFCGCPLRPTPPPVRRPG
jgi:YD repeat-containing protein